MLNYSKSTKLNYLTKWEEKKRMEWKNVAFRLGIFSHQITCTAPSSYNLALKPPKKKIYTALVILVKWTNGNKINFNSVKLCNQPCTVYMRFSVLLSLFHFTFFSSRGLNSFSLKFKPIFVDSLCFMTCACMRRSIIMI